MAKQTFLVICVIMAIIFCLAIEQSQAKPKKGCEAFGHACYGGHGKRSVASTVGLEDIQIHPADAMSQIFSGRTLEQYRRNRLINFLKQLIDGRRPYGGQPTERINNNNNNDILAEYPTSGELFKDNSALN